MIKTCLIHLESRYQWRVPLFAVLLLSLSACSGSDGGAASTSGYTVSAIASDGGSIGQSTATVNEGASASFTFTPDENYSIISVGGTCGGALSGNTFTTDAIAADCTVEASFIANSFTVKATYGTGGNIGPASVIVDRGATTSFTVTSYPGFTTSMGGNCGGTLNGIIYTTNEINANCTVQAIFNLNNYTISTTTSAGGGIDPASAGVNHGNNTSFKLTPFTGYEIDGVSGTCGGTLVGDTYTTAAIFASCTLQANFSLKGYIISTSAGTGGNINPTSIKVTDGNTTSFAVTPNTGYNISSVSGCGGTLNGNTYTTAAVTAACTVVASFVIKNYTVTPSAGANGMIDPLPKTIDHGATTSFTVTPNPNYHASMSGTCGGNLSGNTYTTAAITANCTVVADFILNSYSVTASAEANGSINPAAATVIHGATTSFTVTPNANYSIASVSGCGFGTLVGNTYATAAITADCTVVASFVINNFTVTPSAGANGSISLATPKTVDYGATTSFSVTPNAGYTASVGGSCGGNLSGNTYTTAAITADCTVAASFNPPVLSLTMQSVKTFTFSWANVSNATGYRLLENPDGSSGYTQVATGTLGAGTTSYQLVAFLPGRINASYILQACNGGSCADSNEVFVSGNLASVAGYVKASNTGANDIFGVSVTLSQDGKTLAVGAFGEDSIATDSGAVYVFRRSGTVWSQQDAFVFTATPAAGAEFGKSVALSADGSTLAVGAPSWNSSMGAVLVYRLSGSTWSLEKTHVIAITGGLRFGTSLSLAGDGNTLVVGAPGYDISGLTDIGAAYVYGRSGSTWSLQAGLTSSSPFPAASFGSSVALSADGYTLAVGSPNWINDNMGLVDIFRFSGTSSWPHQTSLLASNAAPGDLFGSSVALSADGNTLAVGAYGEDSEATTIDGNEANDLAADSGAAYVFSRDSTPAWSQQAYIKASNSGAGDKFGTCVALSADGNSLAVGAPLEDSFAFGINVNPTTDTSTTRNYGAAYTFARSGTVWSQQAIVKAHTLTTDDYFGYSVMLSADGNSLAVGAPFEDGSGKGINPASNDSAPQAGAVYLY